MTVDAEVVDATVAFPSGEEWVFVDGVLSEMRDGQGQSVIVERDGAGSLLLVRSVTTGRALQFASTDGLIDSVVTGTVPPGPSGGAFTPDGREVEFTYQELGDGTHVLATFAGIHDTAGAEPHSLETYTVDENGRLTATVLSGVGYASAVADRVLFVQTYRHDGRAQQQTTPEGDVMTLDYEDATHQTVASFSASGDQWTYQNTQLGDTAIVDGPNGTGGGARTFSVDRGELTSVVDPAGTETRSYFDSEGRLAQRVQADPTSGALPSGDGPWTRDLGEGWLLSEWSYDGQDRVKDFTDPAGVVTRHTYEGDERLPDTTTVAYGTAEAATTITRSTDGRVTCIVDPDGVETLNDYDPVTGLLVRSVTDDDKTGAQCVEDGDVRASIFAYTPEGWLESVTTPEQIKTTYTHYANGQLKTQVGPNYVGDPDPPPTTFTWAPDGTLLTSTDPLGRTTTSVVAYPVEGGRVETSTGPTGAVTIDTYDESGDLITAVQQGPAGEAPSTTTSTYGEMARLESTTGPDGATTWYVYGPTGAVLATLVDDVGPAQQHLSSAPADESPAAWAGVLSPDQLGRAALSFYDRAGRLVRMVEPVTGEDHTGAPVRRDQSQVYDKAGRVVLTIDHGGQIMWPGGPPTPTKRSGVEYDLYGRARFHYLDTDADGVRDPSETLSETVYTPGGRTDTTYGPPPDAVAFVWPSDHTGLVATTFGYDDAGQTISVTDAANGATTYSYDDDGRRISTTTPEGRIVTSAYDAAGNVVRQTSPDPSFRPSAPGDPVPVVEVDRSYDLLGRLLSDTDPHPPTEVAPPTRTWAYQLNAGGEQVTVRDANLVPVVEQYDWFGQRVRRDSIFDANTVSPIDDSVVSEAWTYDPARRVASYTDALERTTSWVYDNDPVASGVTAGRLWKIQKPSGRTETSTWWPSGVRATREGTLAASTVTSSYTYDAHGRLAVGSDAHGDTRYLYDDQGRLVARTDPRPQSTTVTAAWEWSRSGLLTAMTTPAGREFIYTHDILGRLDTVAMGAPVPFAVASYSYDDDGLQTGVFLAGSPGGARSWEHSPAGLVSEYTEAIGSAEAQTTTIGHDVTGRIDSVDTDWATSTDSSETYGYDAAGQLTDWTRDADGHPGDELVRTTTYGTRGNRLQVTTGATTEAVTWDQASQLVTFGEDAFTHDHDGNRTNRDGPSRDETWTFDPLGRLAGWTWDTTIGEPGGVRVAEQHLDHSDRVVANRTREGYFPIGHAWFFWDESQPVSRAVEGQQYDHQGSQEGLIYRSIPGNELLALEVDHSTVDPIAVWISHDHLSSRRGEGLDPYTPEGEANTSIASTFGYRSEYTRQDTIHLRARDYDPSTATFLTKDPLDGVPGTPTVANPYHYTDNNPLNKTDPTGLRPSGFCTPDLCSTVPPPPGACAAGPSRSYGTINDGLGAGSDAIANWTATHHKLLRYEASWIFVGENSVTAGLLTYSVGVSMELPHPAAGVAGQVAKTSSAVDLVLIGADSWQVWRCTGSLGQAFSVALRGAAESWAAASGASAAFSFCGSMRAGQRNRAFPVACAVVGAVVTSGGMSTYLDMFAETGGDILALQERCRSDFLYRLLNAGNCEIAAAVGGQIA